MPERFTARRAVRIGTIFTVAAVVSTTLTAFARPVRVQAAGRVFAIDGKPLASAVVTARNSDGRMTTAVTTDAAGRYRFDDLVPGAARR